MIQDYGKIGDYLRDIIVSYDGKSLFLVDINGKINYMDIGDENCFKLPSKSVVSKKLLLYVTCIEYILL